ncbi:hypothetical protein OEZ86_004493 [Tetradesmus obliquus]|nr:hypothetical protein OEZ86_004493 [Tetradesmus obliquus]
MVNLGSVWPKICIATEEFTHNVLGDADEHVIHTVEQQQQQQQQEQQQQQAPTTQTFVVTHAFEGFPEGAKVAKPWFRRFRIAYAVLVVVGIVTWFAVDYKFKLNGLVQDMSDTYFIQAQPSAAYKGGEASKQQSVCLCTYGNKQDDLAFAWGGPYGLVISTERVGPSIFWDYCQASVPPPNTSTAAGVFTERVLNSFCTQVLDMRIVAPVSSIQWSPGSFNHTRLAEVNRNILLAAAAAKASIFTARLADYNLSHSVSNAHAALTPAVSSMIPVPPTPQPPGQVGTAE